MEHRYYTTGRYAVIAGYYASQLNRHMVRWCKDYRHMVEHYREVHLRLISRGWVFEGLFTDTQTPYWGYTRDGWDYVVQPVVIVQEPCRWLPLKVDQFLPSQLPDPSR